MSALFTRRSLHQPSRVETVRADPFCPLAVNSRDGIQARANKEEPLYRMPSIPDFNFSNPTVGVFATGEPVSASDSGFSSVPITPTSPCTSFINNRVGIKSIEYTVEIDQASNRAESIIETEAPAMDPRLWHDWAEPTE